MDFRAGGANNVSGERVGGCRGRGLSDMTRKWKRVPIKGNRMDNITLSLPINSIYSYLNVLDYGISPPNL